MRLMEGIKMHNILKRIQFKNVQLSASLLIMLFIVTGMFHYVFYNTEMDFHESQLRSVEENQKTAIWTLINMAIRDSNKIAKYNAEYVADNIVHDTLALYPQLKTLKAEVDVNGLSNSNLVKIIYQNISNGHLYDANSPYSLPFAMTSDNHVITTYLMNNSNSIVQTFDEYASNTFNKEMTMWCLDSIQKSAKIDVYITEMKSSPSSRKIHFSTINILKSVYEEEGIAGLDRFTILTPAYITDDGDVFGTPDINDNGVNIPNHKIIVVQCCNVGDLVNKVCAKEIAEINQHTELIKQGIAYTMNMRTLSYLAIMLLDIFALLVILYYTTLKIEKLE